VKYAVKTDVRPTTSAGNTRNYVAHITIVKVPWWKRLLKVKP
jgi:hypothetical protein